MTNNGLNRLQEVREKYDKNNEEPIGAYGKALQALNTLDPEIRKKVLEHLKDNQK